MRQNIFYFVILLLSFTYVCSCSDYRNNRKAEIELSKPQFGNEVHLTLMDSVIINDVFDICNWVLSSDRVIIHDNTMDNIIKVYDWPQGRYLFGGFSIGHGPGEFIVTNAGDALDDRNILLYDMMRRKVSICDLSGDSLWLSEEYDLLTDEEGLAYPYTYISQLCNSLFLLKMDLSDRSSWQIADLNDRTVVCEFDNLIRESDMSYTPYDFIQVVADSVVAVIYRYINLIQFYDITDAEKPVLAINYGELSNQAEIESYNDLKYTYISGCRDKSKLFCLKSSDGGECGKLVEVYDLRRHTTCCILELDREVMSIKCNSNGDIIGYAPDQDGSIFYVWKYNGFCQL